MYTLQVVPVIKKSLRHERIRKEDGYDKGPTRREKKKKIKKNSYRIGEEVRVKSK